MNNQFTIGGLNFDTHQTLVDKNSVYYIRNGDISDYGNSNQTAYVQNVSSNELCVKIDGEVVGNIELDKNRQILFVKNEVNDYIYLFDGDCCTLTLVTSGKCLNLTSWVSGSYKYKGDDLVIYFSNKDFVRYLNLSKVPTKDLNECSTCEPIPSLELDCNQLNFWKCTTVPNIKIEQTEGNLPAGVYQIAFSFVDESGEFSEWFTYSEVFNFHPVYNNPQRFGLKVSVECPKSTYKIALISHREDRGTIAEEIGTYTSDVTQVSTISELDSSNYKTLSNEELLLTNSYYQGAEFIENNGDLLVLGGLSERKDFNYQLQANQILSSVDIIKVPAKNSYKYPTYMSDEVYPFYIQWLYCDGQTTPWYHIPSNVEPKPEYFTNVTNNDTWNLECVKSDKKFWQVYNTAKLNSLIESNDNGIDLQVISNTESCKNYRIKTLSHRWRGTLEYYPCGVDTGDTNNKIIINTVPEDFTFCTDDINTAFWQFSSIEPSIIFSDNGKCTVTNVGSNLTDCIAWFATGANSNAYGKIEYIQCQTLPLNQVPQFECASPITPITYEGVLNATQICACNLDSVTLTPMGHTFELLGDCNGLNLDITPKGSECDYTVVGNSDFAYWESGIKYPKLGFENLMFTNNPCEQGIKYHKFPDRTATLNGKSFPHIHSSTGKANAKEYVYILSPRFDNIEFPKDCFGNPVKDIQGYRIGVGDRSNEKSIIHKGLLYNMRVEKSPDCLNDVYFANYPFNDLNPDKFLGEVELLKDPVDTSVTGIIDKSGDWIPMNTYSKKHFQYISPDIQYEKNDQNANQLITYRSEKGYLEGQFNETEELPQQVILSDITYAIENLIVKLAVALLAGGLGAGATQGLISTLTALPETFKKLANGRQYGLNCVLTSDYTKSDLSHIIQTNRRRSILTSFYMQPTKQSLDNIKVNNFQRESGLFLELNDDLEVHLNGANLYEQSRWELSDVKSKYFVDNFQVEKRTASYYVGLKKEVPNQYGFITDSIVKPISNVLKGSSSNSLISGDIWITKHTLIKKFPFFTNLPLFAPYDSPYITSSNLNVGFPKYWLDSTERNELFNLLKGSSIVGLINAIGGLFGNAPINHTRSLDGSGTIVKGSCKKPARLRKPFFTERGYFYTHLVGIVSYYAESSYIAQFRETNQIPESQYAPLIDSDTYKKYSFIENPELFLYSQQQRYRGLNSKYSITKGYDCCEKTNYAKNRVVFSLKQDTFSKQDKWLRFLPNNYHQFNQQDGEFQAMKSIGDSNILFLFDNAAYSSQQDQGILTTEGVIYTGAGSIFERRLRKISIESNGSGGCIDKYSIVNTPFGTYWLDRLRKTFIMFNGQGIEKVDTNMRSWFNEWLDKPVHGHYDPYTQNIYWSSEDWTISYKPEIKQFVSFHDFIPQKYLKQNYTFLTLNGGIWKHNIKNHYQTYYGKTYPFEVGYVIGNQFSQEVLKSIEVHSEFYKNEGFGQKNYEGGFFNKFLVYNQFNTSDIQTLFIKDLSNPNHHLLQATTNQMEVSEVEYDTFRINGWRNIAKANSRIKWSYYQYQIINKHLETGNHLNGLIRGKWYNVHLISEDKPETKKLLQLSVNLKDPIAR